MDIYISKTSTFYIDILQVYCVTYIVRAYIGSDKVKDPHRCANKEAAGHSLLPPSSDFRSPCT